MCNVYLSGISYKMKEKKMVSYKTNVSLLGILIHTNIIKHLYSSLSLGNFIFFFQIS